MNQIQLIKERQSIENAVETLEGLTGFSINWHQNNAHEKGIDGFMILNNQTFPIEHKINLSLSQLPSILQKHKDYPNLILISDSLTERIKAVLQSHKINYLDNAGNSFIRLKGSFILIEGKKATKKVAIDKDKAFTKKGIVIVFHFLNDETLLNQPYRQISEVTGASLDTITKVIQSLKQQGFILQKSNKLFVMIDKKRLFEKWADAYETRLKPHLFIGNFRFLNDEIESNWHNIKLNPTSVWGSEPASDILTNYLHPGIYTLYSTESKTELIKNYRILPDPKGNIQVYIPFTKLENGIVSREFPNSTVPLLTYADMLNSNIARNHEVAQLIYEKYVKQLFE
jgi:hypothetical protein